MSDLFNRFHAGYTLIIGDFPSWTEANALADEINVRGGRIDSVISQQMLLGVVPPELEPMVRGWTGVRFLTRKLTAAKDVPHGDDPAVRGIIAYFNATIDGSRLRDFLTTAASGLKPLSGDAILPPEGYRAMFAGAANARGHKPGTVETTNHLGYDNDSMTDRIGVNVHFVESNGLVDANMYTWTSSAYGDITGRTIDGIDWWHTRAWARGILFLTNVAFRAPWDYPAENQPYEPIYHPLVADRHLWLNAIMAGYGYTDYDANLTTQALKRVRSYNEWFRNAIGGQSAHSVFVVYNPAPAPDAHTDGWYTLAELGGPAIYHPYRPGGYGTSNWGWVYTHEMGHTFWACDEYASQCQGCSSCYVYGPRPSVANGNCENGCAPNSAACMMRVILSSAGVSTLVCPYTAAQIGW
ncbi:MAG: hypothetical protein M3Q69_10410 [Acidobacteriota bacterium]|nr:hypothetical protein [Acidobacteriota bacterium]